MPSNVQLFLGDKPVLSSYFGDKYTEAYLNPAATSPAYNWLIEKEKLVNIQSQIR